MELYLIEVHHTDSRHALVALSHFGASSSPGGSPHSYSAPGVYQCIKYIVKNEGTRALFKGLGPNLVGVAPSRAIYFCAYSKSKVAFNAIFPPDTAVVHVCSAFCAGKFIVLLPFLSIRLVFSSALLQLDSDVIDFSYCCDVMYVLSEGGMIEKRYLKARMCCALQMII